MFIVGVLRSWIRRQVLGLFSRALETNEVRQALVRNLRGSLAWRRGLRDIPPSHELPYAEVARPAFALSVDESQRPIFITARFRSGSTLLWNIFRQSRGVTAYYEPLNERRWFDPETRGRHTDGSHRGVTDYWREYQGMEDLGIWYQERWIDRHLFMDAAAWDPNSREYLNQLIGRARGRAVLQFNRVDFRLPWLRSQFPNAQIVHLYRHPRDQWLSTFQRTPPFPPDGQTSDYWSQDEFYLQRWIQDLSDSFPFLDSNLVDHPYQLFYYLWRLSHAFGRAYADVSVAFEDLVSRPCDTLELLFSRLSVPLDNVERCAKVVEAPRLGRWREYADHAWFASHEIRCERVLAQFFAQEALAPLLRPETAEILSRSTAPAAFVE